MNKLAEDRAQRMEEVTRSWWCAADGAPAAYDHASLDPLHPFGICSARVGPYRVPAHGGHAVPLVATEYERARLLDEQAAIAKRKAHARHIGRRLVKGCAYCNQLRERLFAERVAHGQP